MVMQCNAMYCSTVMQCNVLRHGDAMQCHALQHGDAMPCNAGAHGVCGILLVMMQCMPQLEELYPGQAGSLILDTLNCLQYQRTSSGNLLSSLGSENDK